MHFYVPLGRGNWETLTYIWKWRITTSWTEWLKGICHVWSRSRHFSPSLPGDRYLNLGSWSDLRPKSRGASFGTTLWRHVQRYCSHFLLFMQMMCYGYSLLHRRKFPKTNLFHSLKKLKNDNSPFFSKAWRIFVLLRFLSCINEMVLEFFNWFLQSQDLSRFTHVCGRPAPKGAFFDHFACYSIGGGSDGGLGGLGPLIFLYCFSS